MNLPKSAEKGPEGQVRQLALSSGFRINSIFIVKQYSTRGVLIVLGKGVNQYCFGHSSKAYRPLLVIIPNEFLQDRDGKFLEFGRSLVAGMERFHQFFQLRL